jgi:nicotinamide mononucleotide transporter
LTTTLEIAAVLLGLAYLVFAIREKRLCWIAGGLASGIFLWIFKDAGLPMQALLQVFYIGMAMHGWWHWGQDNSSSAARILGMHYRDHVIVLGSVSLLSIATLLARGVLDEPTAVLDTVSSWGGVLATWLMTRKRLEAWLYWIVIDTATVALYLSAELYVSSALYTLYTALAFIGWRQWQSSYRLQSAV